MEKHLTSWLALGFMWVVFVFAPLAGNVFNGVEMVGVVSMMMAITIYGVKYKEVELE